jgi:ABC-type nitrate/sulfonate/bicarbonate transport system substrate-binding protein
LQGPICRQFGLQTFIVPERDNLQFLLFWAAQGSRFFQAEGVALRIQSPSFPRETLEAVRRGEIDVAVLPPPMCLELVSERAPIVIVANLLANDAINLVVRPEIAKQRKIGLDRPLRDRLLGLRGLKLGVAPNPPTRLRALFTSVGLDADRDIEMVIIGGPQQNAAFAAGEIDALYAHTPYLERALVADAAVLVANQSAGEVPALANRQIHTLVVTRRLRDEQPESVQRLVRALEHAREKVRNDGQATVSALRTLFPERDPKELEVVVQLYQPAMPLTLAVSSAELPRSAKLFPASRPVPELGSLDLQQYVDNRFVERLATPAPPAPALPRRWRWLAGAFALAFGIGGWWLRKKRG